MLFRHCFNTRSARYKLGTLRGPEFRLDFLKNLAENGFYLPFSSFLTGGSLSSATVNGFSTYAYNETGADYIKTASTSVFNVGTGDKWLRELAPNAEEIEAPNHVPKDTRMNLDKLNKWLSEN
jgi:hypothetical protein